MAATDAPHASPAMATDEDPSQSPSQSKSRLMDVIRHALLNDMRRVVDFFLEADLNGDGKVSRKEWVNVLPLILGKRAEARSPRRGGIREKPKQSPQEEAMGALFDELDKDRSGSLDYKELKAELRQGQFRSEAVKTALVSKGETRGAGVVMSATRRDTASPERFDESPRLQGFKALRFQSTEPPPSRRLPRQPPIGEEEEQYRGAPVPAVREPSPFSHLSHSPLFPSKNEGAPVPAVASPARKKLPPKTVGDLASERLCARSQWLPRATTPRPISPFSDAPLSPPSELSRPSYVVSHSFLETTSTLAGGMRAWTPPRTPSSPLSVRQTTPRTPVSTNEQRRSLPTREWHVQPDPELHPRQTSSTPEEGSKVTKVEQQGLTRGWTYADHTSFVVTTV